MPSIDPTSSGSAVPSSPPDAAAVSRRYAEAGLAGLITHSTAVQSGEKVEDVYELFRSKGHEFIAVLNGTQVLGLCSQRQIGMLLGARYGFALFARKPIETQLLPNPLKVSVSMPLPEVFAATFSRSEETYYDDVLLVRDDGTYLGLIYVQTLVRLQHQMLEENIAQLERSRREIARKNQQIEEDLRMARELQLALLPDTYPSFPPGAPLESSVLRFAHRFEPSGTVGGDFFHVRAVGEHLATLFVCDVMGHDVRAALVTAMLRALVEELQVSTAEPAALLAKLNRELRQILRQSGGVLFATAAAVLIDLAKSEIRFSLAGHPPPILLQDSGDCDSLHPYGQKMGPALGIFDDSDFATGCRPLHPGDRLVLYTDGLFEAMDDDGEEFGQPRLISGIRSRIALPMASLLDGILDDVHAHCGPVKLVDDVCLVGVQYHGPA